MVIIRHSHGWFLRMVKVSFPILETIIGFWNFFPVTAVKAPLQQTKMLSSQLWFDVFGHLPLQTCGLTEMF